MDISNKIGKRCSAEQDIRRPGAFSWMYESVNDVTSANVSKRSMEMRHAVYDGDIEKHGR